MIFEQYLGPSQQVAYMFLPCYLYPIEEMIMHYSSNQGSSHLHPFSLLTHFSGFLGYPSNQFLFSVSVYVILLSSTLPLLPIESQLLSLATMCNMELFIVLPANFPLGERKGDKVLLHSP